MNARNYTFYPEFVKEDYLVWHVFEAATSQVIASFFFDEDAQDYCQFLEAGGGFNGFTPSFVLKKTQLTDINENFAMEFAEVVEVLE